MVESGARPLTAEATRKAFTRALGRLASSDSSIVVVTSDAKGSVTLTDFESRYPDRFFEMGIAEQNAVGVGAGLANAGYHPFVCGPACFYSARSLEQVKNDIAYAGSNAVVVGVSGGVAYGALGSTHFSLHDVAVMRAIPGIAVLVPSTPRVTEWITEALAAHSGPAYMRLGRNPVEEFYRDNPGVEIGRAILARDGADLTIVSCGETLAAAMGAAETLSRDGVEARVLDVHTLKPFDRDAIRAAAEETGAIVTVEEHSIYGGLGSAVADVLATEYPVPLDIVAFPDEHPPAGSQSELFVHYGITAASIAERCRTVMVRKRGGGA